MTLIHLSSGGLPHSLPPRVRDESSSGERRQAGSGKRPRKGKEEKQKKKGKQHKQCEDDSDDNEPGVDDDHVPLGFEGSDDEGGEDDQGNEDSVAALMKRSQKAKPKKAASKSKSVQKKPASKGKKRDTLQES